MSPITAPAAPVDASGGYLPWNWHRPWSAEDRTLLDEGLAGERIIARVRLWLTAVIALVPLYAVLTEPNREERIAGLAVALVVMLAALAIDVLVRRGLYISWLGFATSAFDVTAISSLLVAYLGLGNPHLAVNSSVVYALYLLALAATCLRYDPRICITTGALATLQYVTVVLVAILAFPVNVDPVLLAAHGRVSIADQVGRVILIVAGTVLATTIVLRTVRLRSLSIYDSLTGLHNRGFFQDRLVEELLRATRYRRPLAVAILDVDQFKQFNDTHGHPAGDQALRLVAATLRNAVRRTDVVARYGGEEFVLIFPETSAEEALLKLEEIRRGMPRLPIETSHGTVHGVSVSGGIAAWPEDGTWPDELLHAADDRLLEAKRGGRNRVIGPALGVAIPGAAGYHRPSNPALRAVQAPMPRSE
jgi:diguanylate cyclase (GGDEF)-like protein